MQFSVCPLFQPDQQKPYNGYSDQHQPYHVRNESRLTTFPNERDKSIAGIQITTMWKPLTLAQRPSTQKKSEQIRNEHTNTHSQD